MISFTYKFRNNYDIFDSAAVVWKHYLKEIVIIYNVNDNNVLKNVMLLFLLVNFTQEDGLRVSHIISWCHPRRIF